MRVRLKTRTKTSRYNFFYSDIAPKMVQPHLIENTKEMARPERFELPTFWFVARRSIQLS